jgi:hypothetical protein
MATKKVKKFGRGGDILTGVGAALLGKALYDKYMGSQDDKKKDTSTKNEGSGETTPKPRIDEEVTKAQKSSNTSKDETSDKVEAKELSKRGKFPYETEDGTSGASPSEYKSAAPAPAPVIKKDKKAAASTTTSAAKSITGGPPDLKPGQSITVGEGNLKPYPVNLPSVKAAEHRKFLQKRAGLSGTGITTPGDPRKTKATLEPSPAVQRAKKAIEGTIENRNRSTVRTPEQRMAEGAREVERRRKEELAKKQGYGIKKGGMVKKYAAGGAIKASKMGSVKTAKPAMRSASSRADGIAIRGKTRA